MLYSMKFMSYIPGMDIILLKIYICLRFSCEKE